jgi:serine/threonine protein kinase
MDRERLIDELFAQVVELAPAEREKFLADREAEGDLATSSGVLDEVRALLTNYRQAESKEFLNQPFSSGASADGARSLRDGQEFEGYTILKLIAEGGMGEVYLARDPELDRKVAIKLVKGNVKTKEVLRRFRNEQHILANLQHANIARLFEAGATGDGLPFFVMEYVEGKPIDEFASEHELSVTDRLKLFRTVCSAVSYAHQNLVIHRDLKPGNIIVTESDEPKLLDFGIAKLLHEADSEQADATATLFRAMTPQYASPEQVKGEAITTASDVYSLGVLLYELLTGQRPYQLKRQTADEITKAICEQEPTKPSSMLRDQRSEVSKSAPAVVASGPKPQFAIRNPKLLRGDLDNIILKALRKEPQRRYASVEQFSEDIRRHLEGLPVGARKDTFPYRASKFIKRNKVGVAAAVVILVVLLGGIIATAWEAHKARVESARAQQHFNKVRELAHSVLFDYHDQIASLPGSTPVRERLVKDALKYLDELSNDPGNSVSLQRELATAYLKVGDVQGRPYASNLGQTDGALASYQKALGILEPLASRNETDRELQRELATVHERIGNIQLRKGDFNEAFAQNSKALVMRQALMATDSSNKDYQNEVADSYLYVGDALQAKCSDLKCQREALDDQQRALEMKQALANEDPSNPQIQRALRQAHARIGFRLKAIGDISSDRKYYRQWLEHAQLALDISRRLAAADPTNASDRRNAGDQLMATGNAQLENGDTAGALSGYTQSVEIFSALSAADLNNLEALRDLSFVYFRLGAAHAQSGNFRMARESYARSIEVSQQLLAKDTSSEEDLATLNLIYIRLSQLSEKEGDLSSVLDSWEKVVEINERIAALAPNNAAHLYELASAYQWLGILHAKKAGAHFNGSTPDSKTPARVDAAQARQWREAKAAFQKSLEIIQGLASKAPLANSYWGWPEGLAYHIAKCDEALAKVH